ncbi:hypothetical protein PCC82_06110 [Agrobacterium deltaense]
MKIPSFKRHDQKATDRRSCGRNSVAKCSEIAALQKQQRGRKQRCNTLLSEESAASLANKGEYFTHSPSFKAETALFGTKYRLEALRFKP